VACVGHALTLVDLSPAAIAWPRTTNGGCGGRERPGSVYGGEHQAAVCWNHKSQIIDIVS
jgi:hypothetical protein